MVQAGPFTHMSLERFTCPYLGLAHKRGSFARRIKIRRGPGHCSVHLCALPFLANHISQKQMVMTTASPVRKTTLCHCAFAVSLIKSADKWLRWFFVDRVFVRTCSRYSRFTRSEVADTSIIWSFLLVSFQSFRTHFARSGVAFV
jgi:hypothetical protein